MPGLDTLFCQPLSSCGHRLLNLAAACETCGLERKNGILAEKGTESFDIVRIVCVRIRCDKVQDGLPVVIVHAPLLEKTRLATASLLAPFALFEQRGLC